METVTPDQIANTLGNWISSHRYWLKTGCEREFHDTVTLIAKEIGWNVEREWRVSSRDRFDLWMPDYGIVIELKIRPSLEQIVRQLQRYASYDEVKGLVLISVNVPPRFPESVGGKPVASLPCWTFLL